MTSTKTKALLFSLTFSAAAFLGWKIDRLSTSAEDGPYDHSLSSRINPSTVSDEGKDLLIDQRSEKDRLRDAIELAHSLPSSELGAWITQERFTARNGHSLALFQQIALDRWSRSDPASFLDWVRINGGDSLGPQLAVLFKNHPEVLSEALASHQNHRERARLLSRDYG